MNHPNNPFVRCILAALAATAMSPFLVSCESDDAVDPFDVIHEDSDKGSSSKSSISGTWTGRSGSGSYQTTVSVSDNGGAVSGSLRWSWGGKRSFSGSHSGDSVVWTTQADRFGVRDTWRMTLSSDGRRLEGHASKSDGGGYAISLTRQ